MLPGYEFGRDPAELTARIALIDFDGDAALKAAYTVYFETEMNEAFVKTYAPRLTEAFERMREWFVGLV